MAHISDVEGRSPAKGDKETGTWGGLSEVTRSLMDSWGIVRESMRPPKTARSGSSIGSELDAYENNHRLALDLLGAVFVSMEPSLDEEETQDAMNRVNAALDEIKLNHTPTNRIKKHINRVSVEIERGLLEQRRHGDLDPTDYNQDLGQLTRAVELADNLLQDPDLVAYTDIE